VDALTLDGLVREIAPALSGRHVARVRAAEADAILLELSSTRDMRLWVDAGRLAAGVYPLSREQARVAQDEAAMTGRSRQAVLLFRKHLEGRRIVGLRRVRGERVLVLEAAGAAVVLQLSGSPSLTLAVEGEAVATLGTGAPCWAPPPDAPEREWDRVADDVFASAIDEACSSGRSTVRAALDVCPGLGVTLARLVADSPSRTLAELRPELARGRPFLLAPRPIEACDDADLARPDALVLLPLSLPGVDRVCLPQPSWTAGAAALLLGRLRGFRFDRRRRALAEAVAREVRRATQLLAHLQEDLRGLPAPDDLRRQGEALLAAGEATPSGGVVAVPDPYAPDQTLRIALVPAGLHATADRLFAKARRIERAREQVESRAEQVRRDLDRARAEEAAVRAVRSSAALDAVAPRPEPDRGARTHGGPPGVRHYLSSRGLSILVGRGGRENHRLTFTTAGPEDVWLHARDVPGAHVIVRDPEGRAAADDLREAAELAAFFSDAARQGQVDVHVTRRKHVRPARGGAGRVVVGHSETLRVAPRDPEGRLRRR
jgi:predicted ribosome quality control (RQC) complex YloA/Tae2 family protein